MILSAVAKSTFNPVGGRAQCLGHVPPFDDVRLQLKGFLCHGLLKFKERLERLNLDLDRRTARLHGR